MGLRVGVRNGDAADADAPGDMRTLIATEIQRFADLLKGVNRAESEAA